MHGGSGIPSSIGRMDPVKIRVAVNELFSQGDQTIIEYICGILEDEHFEFGDEGEGAYDSIGPFLVSLYIITACS